MLTEMLRSAMAGIIYKSRTMRAGHRITGSGVAKWMCGDGFWGTLLQQELNN